jgi:hypothetical protein
MTESDTITQKEVNHAEKYLLACRDGVGFDFHLKTAMTRREK